MPDFKKFIAQRTISLRDKLKITQADLAKKAKTNVVTISNIENGKSTASLDTLHNIVTKGFGITLSEFFKNLEPVPPRPPKATIDELFRMLYEEVKKLQKG